MPERRARRIAAAAPRRPAGPMDAPSDLGADPRRVIVETVADPSDPNRNIRRARAYDPLLRMSLPVALFLAAERFRDAWAIANGAREQAGGSTPPWQRAAYVEHVAAARGEVQASLQAVGLRLTAPFVAAVVLLQRIRDMERDLGIKSGAGAELVREALQKLAAWQQAQPR